MDAEKLPVYHKLERVRACKIKDVKMENGVPYIVPEEKGLEPFKPGTSFLNRFNPKPGNYYVVKEGITPHCVDGQAFEENYIKANKKSPTSNKMVESTDKPDENPPAKAKGSKKTKK